MATNSTFTTSRPAGSAFELGQKVSNFGIVGVVVGWHRVTGDLILKDPARPRAGSWVADPAKCEAL